MVEKRLTDLLVGSMAALIVLLDAFHRWILDRESEYFGPTIVLIYAVVAVVSLGAYFSPRVRKWRETFSQSRPVRVFFLVFGLAVLALVGDILLRTLWEPYGGPVPYPVTAFWVFTLGALGVSAVYSAVRRG